MARSKELTPAIRERICELHAIGWGYKRIHTRYPDIALSTIRYTVKKEKERRDGVPDLECYPQRLAHCSPMPRLFDNGYRVEPPLNNDIPKCIEFHLTQSSCIIYLSEQLKLDLDLIVLNCTLATVENVVQCDVGVKDDKVHSIVLQGSLVGLKAKRIIDAKGALVTPGGIDAHVHLQEPPLFGLGSTADSFESGTRAGIAGGTTTILALTNVPATNATATTRSISSSPTHAQRRLRNFQPSEKWTSRPSSYTTYEALRLNDKQFLDVLFQSRLHKATTLVHAENDSVVVWMTKKLHEPQLYAPKYDTASQPAIAEKVRTIDLVG
ncbi:hypothetical protein PENNAL_c0039G09391 [Penicillium nalgiovense]|uniref:Amidohydrolase-related domain-containing protein n=1 Tax=Penicillium nalgiovense TaxID=60175 RepID=A0A1V6Y329_PENNA|nr:hypothetical protein PENNAL_c0039G09391 [Penicillium nalgiovense]